MTYIILLCHATEFNNLLKDVNIGKKREGSHSNENSHDSHESHRRRKRDVEHTVRSVLRIAIKLQLLKYLVILSERSCVFWLVTCFCKIHTTPSIPIDIDAPKQKACI